MLRRKSGFICKFAPDKKTTMESRKNLYPLKFIPVAVKEPWGGNALTERLGKEFVECDSEGNEVRLTSEDRIGESWEISDMGFIDSVVAEGWLAGNTFEEIMETYIERISGENVYQFYGRQFPVLVKFLDIKGRTPLQVHPDDEVAAQRYDSLGKCKMWYVMDAAPDARVYMGFRDGITAQELYDKCQDGTIGEKLNVIRPEKGDFILIRPGTVHAAGGGLLIAEIQESSDLTFNLFDWDKGKGKTEDGALHLEEAFDIIDMGPYDISDYHRQEAGKAGSGETTAEMVSVPQFSVSGIQVREPLKISNGQSGSFLIYICVEGKAGIQVPGVKDDGSKCMDSYGLKKGETVLVPADMPDFFIVPEERDTMLLEVRLEKQEETDSYINPETEPYLEGEDYGGVEDIEGEEDE